jgi:hypothetical protein
MVRVIRDFQLQTMFQHQAVDVGQPSMKRTLPGLKIKNLGIPGRLVWKRFSWHSSPSSGAVKPIVLAVTAGIPALQIRVLMFAAILATMLNSSEQLNGFKLVLNT